jgi:TrmH family RNA methyltransferase
MLSKSQIKRINSLQQKKYRNKLGLFIVEGKKSVNEFLMSDIKLDSLFYTTNYIVDNKILSKQEITQNELHKITALKNANQVLAVFEIPNNSIINNIGLSLVLDDIKDPGNLGTIIRLCDWFGINQLICSKETVDCYNPKVVQASMGSLTRVQVIYTDLQDYLNNTTLPVFVSLMEGDNIYKTTLPKEAIIIMGNEANGIANNLINLATNKISIPRFGALHQTESLNVATATAIILSEFKR